MLAEGVTLFYEYAGIALGNSDDEIELLDAAMQQVDIVAWDGGPDLARRRAAAHGLADNALGAAHHFRRGAAREREQQDALGRHARELDLGLAVCGGDKAGFER